MVIKEIIEYFESMSERDYKKMQMKLTTDKEQELYALLYDFFHGKNYPKTIYHYTNFVALEGILCGEGLRMCRSDNMNDKKEVFNFVELAEKSLLKRFKGDQKKSIEIRNKFKQELAARKNDIAYLVSFSTWCDDVSQWERYGNNGRGVNIAFNVNKLKDLVETKMVALQRVFYGKNADHHQLIDVLEDLFLQEQHVRWGFYQNDWKAVFDNMWAVSVAHKHSSFLSEQEYRLMTLPAWSGKRYDKLGDLFTVMTSSGPKECLYLNWKEYCNNSQITYSDLITGIIIGPRSNVKVSELQQWLTKIGMECLAKCVRKSNSPLI